MIPQTGDLRKMEVLLVLGPIKYIQGNTCYFCVVLGVLNVLTTSLNSTLDKESLKTSPQIIWIDICF